MFGLIIRNSGYKLISGSIEKVLFLVLTVVISRVLGKEGLGTYSFVFAFIGLLYVLVDFGVGKHMVVRLSRDPKAHSVFIETFCFRLLMNIVLFFLINILFLFFEYSDDLRTYIWVVYFFNLLGSLLNVMLSVFQAFQQMKYEAFIFLVRSFVTVILACVLILGGFGIISLFFSFLIGQSIAFIMTYYFFVRRFWHFRFAKINFSLPLLLDMLRYGFPFLINSVFILLVFRVDVFMIKEIQSIGSVGLYKAATSVIFNSMFILSSFLSAAFPAFSSLHKNNRFKMRKIYRRLLGFLVIMNLAGSAAIFIFSEVIVRLLYGRAFLDAVPALKILSVAGFFIHIILYNVTFLNSIKRSLLNAKIFFLGLLLNLVLNYFLIRSLDFLGAAIATLITFSLIFIIQMVVVWRLYAAKKM
jgi:O-antigen/teichoic acid export membrane protein